MPDTRKLSDSQAWEQLQMREETQAREAFRSQRRESSCSQVWERPDLREELVTRLRDPVTRQRIADALITEAEGGPPDPKSGQPKGGATVIRAFELIREIALERPPDSAAAFDFSAYTDVELSAMLTRLESGGETEAYPGGAAGDYG